MEMPQNRCTTTKTHRVFVFVCVYCMQHCTSPSNDHLHCSICSLLTIWKVHSWNPSTPQNERDEERCVRCEWCQCTTNGQQVLCAHSAHATKSATHEALARPRSAPLFGPNQINSCIFFFLHSAHRLILRKWNVIMFCRSPFECKRNKE